jgi:hypothetical protein
MRCPACDGFMRREPSTVVCILCGRFGIVLDAAPAARLRQLVIDRERRPRSIEATPPFNDAEYLGPRRLRAAAQTGPRLPGCR